MTVLRARQRFGKYIIERRIAEGGFATVYQARDTIEGIRVALKIPFAYLLNDDMFDYFKQEVRLAARLDHPNILPLKYADYLGERFVIVTALGEMSLEDRLQKRISLSTTLQNRFWQPRPAHMNTESFIVISSLTTSSCSQRIAFGWEISEPRMWLKEHCEDLARERWATLHQNKQWGSPHFAQTSSRWDSFCTGCFQGLCLNGHTVGHRQATTVYVVEFTRT